VCVCGFGLLLTWHTLLGRNVPTLASLIAQGVRGQALAERLAALPFVDEAFEACCAWVDAVRQEAGCGWWACCFELGVNSVYVGRIHQHAFMCVDPARLDTRAAITPPSLPAARLVYDGQAPHCRPVVLTGRRRHSEAAFSGGMYYVLADAAIDLWQRQFEPPEMERLLRFRPLLLRGRSRSGKTCKAQSLFGVEHALLVNCQGLKDCLPSIRAFQRSVHKAILWDEISPAQVCTNKLIFHSGPMPITLAQSACNGFAYDKWLYGVRHILCSNVFPLVAEPGVKGGLSAEDSEWLQANIIVADLEPGEVWFVRKTSAASLSQSSRVSENSPARSSRGAWACLPLAE